MIPNPIQTLISRCIRSPIGLETLLLLHRSRDTYWSVAAVASAVGAPVEVVREAMAELEQAGLLERATAAVAFRYAPTADGAIVDALAAAYEADRDLIMATLRGTS